MNKLTKEEILDMKPGQIDRHIHEMLFGGEDLSEFVYKGNGSYVKVTETSVIWRDVPNYSTDISAAWEVVEKLQKSHMYTDIRTCADFYEVWVQIPPFQEEPARTETVAMPKPPEAICKAALLAVLEGINLPGEETT